MADSRFFQNKGSFSLGQLSKIAQAELHDIKSENLTIYDVAPLDVADAKSISFLDNPKYIGQFKTTNAAACIIDKKNLAHAPKNIALLICENPYLAYTAIAGAFYPPAYSAEISPQAYIAKSAVIGKNSTIESGTYIGDNVQIGDNCHIGANANITHAIIADNVIIHRGVSIGQDGFGYAFNGKKHLKVPQIGRVIIESNVEIGANSCIDRGSSPDTIIGAGTKIDNLVQIGHNVKIGKNCIIVAQVGIAGSCVIEDYVVIGGQAGIAGHLKIGAAAQIAGQSGVTKNLRPKEVVCGMPAIAIQQFHRQAIILKKLATKKD